MSVQVTGALARGTDVVFRVDIQGAQTVRRVFPDAVSLFLVGRRSKSVSWRYVWPGGTVSGLCCWDLASSLEAPLLPTGCA